MALKAVLFDFNGVIINDESIHQELINELLISENLRPNPDDYNEVCLGRSDRACLKALLTQRGRFVTEETLLALIEKKKQAYQQRLETLEKLPIYPGVTDFIFQLRAAQIPMAVVSGALREEVELVLERANLASYVSVIVAGNDITASKPEPDGYLLAIEQLNQQNTGLFLRPEDCLAIEDTPAGIQAAKAAGISVVGVANTYPFHMMQRQANWAVDYLSELELDRIRRLFSGNERPSAA